MLWLLYIAVVGCCCSLCVVVCCCALFAFVVHVVCSLSFVFAVGCYVMRVVSLLLRAVR